MDRTSALLILGVFEDRMIRNTSISIRTWFNITLYPKIIAIQNKLTISIRCQPCQSLTAIWLKPALIFHWFILHLLHASFGHASRLTSVSREVLGVPIQYHLPLPRNHPLQYTTHRYWKSTYYSGRWSLRFDWQLRKVRGGRWKRNLRPIYSPPCEICSWRERICPLLPFFL